jgi:hypothetical protein
MNPTLRRIVFKLYDIGSYPFTAVSAFHMKVLRRYGIPNFPLARRELLRQGVFPIRRHFYEPQFHPGDLPDSFAQERDLPGLKLNSGPQLKFLEAFRWQDEVRGLADKTIPVLANGTTFDIDNVGFHPGDIDFYYQIIRLLRPRRIIEIGSGHSTVVALSALEKCQQEYPRFACELTAIEPYPWFRHPNLRLIVKRVEDVSLDEFSTLQEGDILFVDSSHMVRPCGDVEYEYLKILPRLNRGVYIHAHDIFTPFNYPELWVKSWHHFWNEQYVLEALLSGGSSFEVVAALHYLSRKFPEESKRAMPLLAMRNFHPHSFWFKKA